MTKPKYDWDAWMDGETHEVVEGEDYHCKRKSFVTMLRHQAFYAGTRVSVDNNGPNLRFQFGDNPQIDKSERAWRWHKGEKVYEDA